MPFVPISIAITPKRMKISFIGKFARLHDEEYIARSLESLGHEVQRLSEGLILMQYKGLIREFNPDFVLFTKLCIAEPAKLLEFLKMEKIKTVSWTFDLYWDYPREERIPRVWGFKADKVFTTDGGHDEKWQKIGIDHQTVRQGIYKPECYLVDTIIPKGIAFVGSENPYHPSRQKMMEFLKGNYQAFKWYGRSNTNELRGTALNRLFARTQIIVGDSVYSPQYWSNRVVETLGRGGFLIHQDVEGLSEEFPYLVTYKKDDLDDFKSKVNYYIKNEAERWRIVRKNFDWVKENYTMDKKCAELISKI